MPNRLIALTLALPTWADRAYRRLGLKALVNGFIRYTFMGEYFERFVQDLASDLQFSTSAEPDNNGTQQGKIRTAG